MGVDLVFTSFGFEVVWGRGARTGCIDCFPASNFLNPLRVCHNERITDANLCGCTPATCGKGCTQCIPNTCDIQVCPEPTRPTRVAPRPVPPPPSHPPTPTPTNAPVASSYLPFSFSFDSPSPTVGPARPDFSFFFGPDESPTVVPSVLVALELTSTSTPTQNPFAAAPSAPTLTPIVPIPATSVPTAHVPEPIPATAPTAPVTEPIPATPMPFPAPIAPPIPAPEPIPATPMPLPAPIAPLVPEPEPIPATTAPITFPVEPVA